MKQLQIMRLSAMVVFVVAGGLASSASAIALPNNMPESSTARS